MVSNLTIINLVLAVILILSSPLIFFWIFKKEKGMFLMMALGALGFFLAQYLIRLPILSVLSENEGFMNLMSSFFVYAPIMAISAALLDFIMKLIIIKGFVLKKEDEPAKVLALGFGYGSLEAIFLVALTFINNLVFVYYINSRRINELLAMSMDTNLMNNIIATLIDGSPWYFLMIGIERILLLLVHMALTILIYQGVKAKKQGWKSYVLAFGMHVFLEMSVSLMKYYKFPLLAIEIYVGILAYASIKIIRSFYRTIKEENVL